MTDLFFNIRIVLRAFYTLYKFVLTLNRGKIKLARVVSNTGIQTYVKKKVLNLEKKSSLEKNITIQREIVAHVEKKTI